MSDSLIFSDTPDLVNPYILIGYYGWLNAGNVATGSIDYLRHKLSARKFATIDSRHFYIWQVPGFDSAQIMRPRVVVEGGRIKSLDEPANDFFFWRSGAEHDLILFTGFEPNVAWPEYTSAVLSVAKRFKACRIYILGGVFDQVPHTRDTSVYAVLSSADMKNEFRSFPLLNYTGPCSFSTLLVDHAAREGIEAASIVARVPPYVESFNAKISHDLLQKVLAHTSLTLDLSDLKKSGDVSAALMDKDFSHNKTALKQLRKLEEAYDAALLPNYGYQEVSVDELMQEIMNVKKDGRKPH
ncbi:MAG: PAC2 family protein [Syntrophaceae bacterium]|jgi:proteasome assembly chaperone (PAC2) family protein|nr:PAC2 family protein [Syntrophaceae bacterium]